MEPVTELVIVITRLLASVRDLKKTFSGGDCAIVLDFREAMSSILDNLFVEAVVDRAEQSRGAIETIKAAEVIVRDTLVRLDILSQDASAHATAITVNQVWSDDSVVALEARLAWLREETQHEWIATSAGSRTLWTGPLQRPQDPKGGTAEPEMKPSLAAEDVHPALSASIKATLANNDKAELLHEFVLERLTFTNLKVREEEVSKAHSKTFEWVFAAEEDDSVASKESNSLTRWLRNETESQIYWINGKAGSGKSTLMRYIVEHKQTSRDLQQWAGRTPLSVITFFFWTSGSILQRSQTGLLRSLLFQLLDQRRDLIPWTFPELWMACQDTKKRIDMVLTWETPELLQALHRSFGLGSKDTKLCLFIDGLDEFEGDEATIINLVRDLVGLSPNIKVCISSRPWTAFEKAFSEVPHMLLQELTLKDMDQYISSQMRDNIHTRRLMRKNANGFEHLRIEMLNRAQGVFLWTSLAFRTLFNTVDKDTTLDGIYASLLQLPSDLEDLFEHLLFDGRNPAALRRQSHAFQIVRARDTVCNFTGDESVRAISVFQMALAHGGQLDHIPDRISEAVAIEVLTRCKGFADILALECANLLIITGRDELHERTHARFSTEEHEVSVQREATRRIQYLHRTVRDFLEYSNVWEKILANGDPSYDAHEAVLLSHVLKLRAPLEPPNKHRRLDEWWHDDIVLAMTHARYAALRTAETQAYLLDKLNETLNWYWKSRPADESDNWARSAFGSYEDRTKHKTPFHHPFLSLAAKFGLAGYLRIKLADRKHAFKAGIPLLSYALEFLVDRRKTVYPLSSSEVVAAILESGESPNQQYQDMSKRSRTPWLMSLQYLREGDRRGWIQAYDTRAQGTQRWVEILGMMLDDGADPKVAIAKDQWDPEATPLSVVSAVASKYYSADVHGLQRKLVDKM